MNILPVIVILVSLVTLAVLAARKGRAQTKPPPPEEVAPEIPEEDLKPPAPELPTASVSIKGVRLTFSKYVSIIPGNVNPEGSTFYVVTTIVRPGGTEYGTKRAISLASGKEVPTMAKLGMDGGNTELAYIKLWIYTKQGGTLIYSRVWWPDELMGPHSPMPA